MAMIRSLESVMEYLGETPANKVRLRGGKESPKTARSNRRVQEDSASDDGTRGSTRTTGNAGAGPARMAIPRAPALRNRVIAFLAQRLDVSQESLLQVSDIAPGTFHRRQQSDENLTPAESDRVLRISRVAQDAERVFGDAAKASRWLKSENRILGAVPLALLGTDAGAKEVEMELGRIDHGIFA